MVFFRNLKGIFEIARQRADALGVSLDDLMK